MPEKEKRTIHFKLGEKQGVWISPDKSINLSIFPGTDGKARNTGKISSDDLYYSKVVESIRLGILLKISEEDGGKPQQVVVRNITDIRENSARVSALAKQFLDMRSEQIIISMSEINEPSVLSKMIELESKGETKWKRRRPEIINATKAKLSSIKDIPMTEFTEYGDDINADVNQLQGKVKLDKTVDEATSG